MFCPRGIGVKFVLSYRACEHEITTRKKEEVLELDLRTVVLMVAVHSWVQVQVLSLRFQNVKETFVSHIGHDSRGECPICFLQLGLPEMKGFANPELCLDHTNQRLFLLWPRRAPRIPLQLQKIPEFYSHYLLGR